MKVTILIPTPFRPHTANQASVTVSASTVDESLHAIATLYPRLHRHLFAEDGTVRGFINVYLNHEDVRYLNPGQTSLKDGDIVTIIPSIAGGGDRRAAHADTGLTREEALRYSRHLIMPEVGMDGQKKLKEAKVLLVGAGGLGSPAALYLAAAGVGTIGIVDYDVVDLTNLQRQVLHSTKNIGRSKLDSSRERIHEINPHVNVESFGTKLTSENAMRILQRFDIVIDGTDNFPTRYLINDACVLLGKPNVYGSIFRFEGQVSVFASDSGPCYRCLYPAPPPPGLVPSCAEGGVLGVLPGIIGSLQALEAIKIIIGRGDSLIGRLVLFDALGLVFREVRLKKSPDCPVCGEHPTIHALIDYDQFCGVASHPEQSADREENAITPKELKSRLDRGNDLLLLDVREPGEYALCNLGGHLIPLRQLRDRSAELNRESEIVVYCKSGRRSAEAAEILRSLGFRQVVNLLGGIDRWIDEVDPALTRY